VENKEGVSERPLQPQSCISGGKTFESYTRYTAKHMRVTKCDSFLMDWRAADDLRQAELVKVMSILQEGYGLPNLHAEAGQLQMTEEHLKPEFERRTNRAGVMDTYFSSFGLGEPRGAYFHVRTGIPHDQSLYMSDLMTFADAGEIGSNKLVYLERCVEASTCAEAYAYNGMNERALRMYLRERFARHLAKPGIIRWWHYVDKVMVASLGGMEFCMKTPAWRVREFHDGALIQLTEDEFDHKNTNHRKVQEEVMRYFGIWDLPITKKAVSEEVAPTAAVTEKKIKRIYSDEEIMEFLVRGDLTLEGYWISENPFGEVMCYGSVGGSSPTFIIDNQELAEDCISFLRERGAPVRRIGFNLA
jgi:hypothetical protein